MTLDQLVKVRILSGSFSKNQLSRAASTITGFSRLAARRTFSSKASKNH
jgi:hypothetical protein